MHPIKKMSLLALAGLASSVLAAPIEPSYGSFGPLSDASWGGSGIPNNPAAIKTIGNPVAGNQVVLGLIAHQRYGNPALGNDGAGTYFATSGTDSHVPSSATDPYARWNFGFYLDGALSNYSYALFYDFDPAADTEQSEVGRINFACPSNEDCSTIQDSWNLGMDFLGVAAAGIITPPLFGAFDPNVAGQYGFALVAYRNGDEVGRTAILVDVAAQAVPEPASLALVGAALLGMFGLSRRRS